METELGTQWLLEPYRKGLLLLLRPINSEIEEIEKADSPPSQSNFEILRDSLLLAVKIIESGSSHDYWIFLELCYALSLVLGTFSEVDSPRLRKIIETLQSSSFIKEAIFLRKFQSRWSPSHVKQAIKLYLYFCCSFGPIRYTLYEIELPISDTEIRYPPKPILELKTSKYPDSMCCVQLGIQLYFFGGEIMNGTQNVLPQDVYVFNLTLYHKCHDIYRRMGEDMLLMGTPMYSGKASPLAFVAGAKIYVIGSKLDDLEDNRLVYFESYDPYYDQWSVLQYPRIQGRHKWVGNAVVRGVAFLIVMQQGKRYVFRFNLDTQQWSRKSSPFDSHLCNLTGKIEFVGNNLYGCCHNTLLKLAVTEEDLTGGTVLTEEDLIGVTLVTEEGGEGGEEEEEEGEEEERGEGDLTQEIELQRVERLLCNYNRFRRVSRENGMDAIYNVPRQVQSSTTLLHLESGYFCYVRTGKPPPQNPVVDYIFEDDDAPVNRDRYTSIVFFCTAPNPRETYEEIMARFFQAQLVKSKHHTYRAKYGQDDFIKGCYVLGRPRSYSMGLFIKG